MKVASAFLCLWLCISLLAGAWVQLGNDVLDDPGHTIHFIMRRRRSDYVVREDLYLFLSAMAGMYYSALLFVPLSIPEGKGVICGGRIGFNIPHDYLGAMDGCIL